MKEFLKKTLLMLIVFIGIISIIALRLLSIAYSPIDLNDNSWLSILYAWGVTILSAVLGLLVVKFGIETFGK